MGDWQNLHPHGPSVIALTPPPRACAKLQTRCCSILVCHCHFSVQLTLALLQAARLKVIYQIFDSLFMIHSFVSDVTLHDICLTGLPFSSQLAGLSATAGYDG